MDLLTVLVHEVGHLLGLPHGEGDVMQDTLPAAARRLPTAALLRDPFPWGGLERVFAWWAEFEPVPWR
jgi:hypothetical protein